MADRIFVYASGRNADNLGAGAGGLRCISGLGDQTQAQAATQTLCRASYTSSRLQVEVTVIDGTASAEVRKNGVGANQVLSLTAVGRFTTPSSTTDSFVDGDLIGIRYVAGVMHGNNLTVSNCGCLMNSGSASRPMLVAFGAPGSFGTSQEFGTLSGEVKNTTTEANAQLILRNGKTFQNLRLYMSANSYMDLTTWRFRVNGVHDTNTQSVTFDGGQTGAKENTDKTDVLNSGDLFCFVKDSGGGSGSGTVTHAQELSLSDSHPSASTSVLGTSSSFYSIIGGGWDSTQTNVQITARVTPLYRNAQAYVSANTRSSSTEIGFRVNGAFANGGVNKTSPKVTFTTSQTGRLEDTTNAYSCVSGDLINNGAVLAAGSGSITIQSAGCEQVEAAEETFSFPAMLDILGVSRPESVGVY